MSLEGCVIRELSCRWLGERLGLHGTVCAHFLICSISAHGRSARSCIDEISCRLRIDPQNFC